MEQIRLELSLQTNLLCKDKTKGIDFYDLAFIEKDDWEVLAKFLGISFSKYSDKYSWALYENEYSYFKKLDQIKYILNELLGEYIAKYMGLPTVSYQLVLKNGKIAGILSKNFRNKAKTYFEASELSDEDYDYLNKLLDTCEGDINLLNQIIAMIVKDFFTCLRDRYSNTLVEKIDDKLALSISYDYEFSFSENLFDNCYKSPLFMKEPYIKRKPREFGLGKLQSLLDISEYANFCYERMQDFDMKRALNNISVEKEIVIPREFKDYYCGFMEIRKKAIHKQLKRGEIK